MEHGIELISHGPSHGSPLEWTPCPPTTHPSSSAAPAPPAAAGGRHEHVDAGADDRSPRSAPVSSAVCSSPSRRSSCGPARPPPRDGLVCDERDQPGRPDAAVHGRAPRHGGWHASASGSGRSSTSTSPAPGSASPGAPSTSCRSSLTMAYHVPRNDALAARRPGRRRRGPPMDRLRRTVDGVEPRPHGDRAWPPAPSSSSGRAADVSDRRRGDARRPPTTGSRRGRAATAMSCPPPMSSARSVTPSRSTSWGSDGESTTTDPSSRLGPS